MIKKDEWLRTDGSISKEEFVDFYEKNKPNVLVRFIYKNFGGKLNIKPIPYGAWTALLCFAVATIGMIYGDQTNNTELANKFVMFYFGFVAMFPITLYAFLTKNKTNKKIASKLGLSIDEYNEYVKEYIKK